MDQNKRPGITNLFGERKLSAFFDPDESRELLTNIARSAQRGTREVAALMPACADELFASELRTQRDALDAFLGEALIQLGRYDEEYQNILVKSLRPSADAPRPVSSLASARIHRLIPAVIDMTRAIHRFSHAEPPATKLANDLLAFTETTLDRMRGYL